MFFNLLTRTPFQYPCSMAVLKLYLATQLTQRVNESNGALQFPPNSYLVHSSKDGALNVLICVTHVRFSARRLKFSSSATSHYEIYPEISTKRTKMKTTRLLNYFHRCQLKSQLDNGLLQKPYNAGYFQSNFYATTRKVSGILAEIKCFS